MISISLLESRGVKQKIPSELYDLVPKKEDIEEAILKREAKRERKKIKKKFGKVTEMSDVWC